MSAGELIVQAGVGFGAAAIGAWATLLATAKASRRALDTALQVDRTQRREEQADARRVVLHTVVAELRLNIGAVGAAHAWHSHALMQHSSLDAAIAELSTLPLGVAIQIEEAVYAMRQYNAAAQYSNERVAVGSGAADTEIARLREVARQKMEVAAQGLSQYLGDNDANGG
ncbi:MAG: hypothetical protein LC808_43200 [Actinobacteria bacterium]|nr:hypothetical protein [Actinomycetota bacterium]